jgi:ribonucleoside-diphosphate reductase alpha chain
MVQGFPEHYSKCELAAGHPPPCRFPAAIKRGEREKLPAERTGMNHHFVIYHMTDKGLEELDGYIRTGEYPDGRLGEIFVTIGKPGSTHAMYDQWALGTSMALQYGVPVKELFNKHKDQRFEPAGGTNDPIISRCTSVVDYIAKWIISKYGNHKTPDELLAEKKANVDGH